MTDSLLRRLAALVAYDTQNPTGDERPMAQALAGELKALGARSVELLPVGSHHSVVAQFGTTPPTLLVNAHVDTVPINTGYTRPPHEMVVDGDRCYGLGTADTKGAIAAILEALRERQAQGRPPEGLAVLFSGDEENGSGCVRSFLAEGRAHGITRAIVCEPTGCRVGHRHRGIGAATVTARSQGGHSSLADELAAPIVILARVALALDGMGKRYRDTGEAAFRGLCLNVAGLDGGVAFNIVPTQAQLTFSLRPGPGASSVRALLEEAETLAQQAAAPEPVTFHVQSEKPAFQTKNLAAFAPLLDVSAPVDLPYWTEAALFAAAGVDAVVFGPGKVGQAHAADEYVDVAELAAAQAFFQRVFA